MMAENVLKRCEELLTQGTQLIPLGGFDFSGYNARLQNKYLEWRKACLELLEQVGPIGFSYKTKILGDSNGGFFFQSSTQLIVNQVKDLFEKLKVSPELASGAAPTVASAPAQQSISSSPGTGGARVLKPPPKPAGQPAPATTAGKVGKRVFVVGEETDPLRLQLSQFLQEVGIEEVALNRQHGQMLMLDKISRPDDVGYAFFVVNSDDLSYAMFELGHFVGKLGAGRVMVLHMTDVNFPKNVPGVMTKPIVVKLEEASLSVMKELKSVGYQISL